MARLDYVQTLCHSSRADNNQVRLECPLHKGKDPRMVDEPAIERLRRPFPLVL
jgi:hypothetical protein